MTPKKRTTRPAAAATVPATTRVTRSSAREGRGIVVPAVDNPERCKKKAKTTTTTTQKEAEDPPEAPPQSAERMRTIIIEYWEQHKTFRKRALEFLEEFEMRLVEKRLQDRFQVVVNPVEPREGCFEVREEGGMIFESMQGLTGVKALIPEELVAFVLEMITR